MYYFFLVLFVIISFLLISIIIFQPNEGNDISSSIGSNTTNIFVEKVRTATFIQFTIFLIFLFFIVNLVLCNINNIYLYIF